MKIHLSVAAILASLTSSLALWAQVPNEGLANSIIAARQKNAQMMQQYSWNSRIEVLSNGAVKDTRIEQCVYGPNNQVQRTLLNDTGSSLPHGFLRRRIAEREREQTADYLKQILALLDKYTLPNAGAVINFISSSPIPPPGPNGELQFTGGSVVQPGDTLSVWIYAPTRATRKVTVVTTDSDGDQVNATATYRTLDSGLNFLQYGTVDVPARGLSIQIHNYDYINQNN
jgi:hypothetical protein